MMQRIIFLVDMNAFYITCEMSRRPELWHQPAAVAGDPLKRTGIILAANYPARSLGVKTAMTVGQALRLCPGLVCIPPDHDFYTEKSKAFMLKLSDYSPLVEKNSIDEAWLDMTGTERILGAPEAAAQMIMDDLKEHLSLWCSIGISENKFLSKMASDMKKPLGITTLWHKEIPQKLWPLPVNRMWGIGEKTSDKLRKLHILTIGDLAKADSHELTQRLGENILVLQRKAQGIDNTSLVSHSDDDMKSIGRSTTLAKDAFHVEEVRNIFMSLAEDVGRRARLHNKMGATVQIQIKLNDFTSITRQVQMPSATCYTQDLFEVGFSLMKNHWPSRKGVRLIGISLSQFENNESTQMSIFDLSQSSAMDNASAHSHQKIDEVMDQIRQKYGADKIARASLLKLKNHSGE